MSKLHKHFEDNENLNINEHNDTRKRKIHKK